MSMKLAVVTEENGIKSVWYPDVTDEEWREAIEGFVNYGCSVSGTAEQVIDDLKETFGWEDESDE